VVNNEVLLLKCCNVIWKGLFLQDKGSGGKHLKKEKKLTNIGIEVALLIIVDFSRILEFVALVSDLGFLIK